MDGVPISALAALAGSVVGGVTALGTSWLTQQAQARVQENARDRTAREALYGDFIVEASRLYGDAWVNEKPEMSNLIGLYAMVRRMRVRSSPGSSKPQKELLSPSSRRISTRTGLSVSCTT
jgi:hypothetical protein